MTWRWSCKGCLVMSSGKGGASAAHRAARRRVPCFHLLPWRGGLATMARRPCYHGAAVLLPWCGDIAPMHGCAAPMARRRCSKWEEVMLSEVCGCAKGANRQQVLMA
jgi:hypothetical protein